MKEQISLAINCKDLLGECPIWHKSSQSLWRVDILGKSIHSWKPEENNSKEWVVSKEISYFSPNDDCSLGLAALEDGVYVIDLNKNQEKLIGNPSSNTEKTRFNDGKFDLNGNLWIGSMDRMEREPIGNLYVINKDLNITKKYAGLIISNGIDWSPDNKIMYLTDSGEKTIWAFDFDQDNLQIDNKRTFIVDDKCFPDGLTVDSQGYIWSAKWDGSSIVKYSPSGSILEVYELPIKRPTSITFGGMNLNKLYITSASIGLNNESGLDGSVFEINTKSQGKAEPESIILSDIII